MKKLGFKNLTKRKSRDCDHFRKSRFLDIRYVTENMTCQFVAAVERVILSGLK